MSRHQEECALYKGDELIGIGSAKELADLMGVSESSIRFYGSPSYQKRTNSARSRRLVKLED